jgi:hypothetical protein
MCVKSFALPHTRRLGHHFTPHISHCESRAGPEVLEKRMSLFLRGIEPRFPTRPDRGLVTTSQITDFSDILSDGQFRNRPC